MPSKGEFLERSPPRKIPSRIEAEEDGNLGKKPKKERPNLEDASKNEGREYFWSKLSNPDINHLEQDGDEY